MTTLRPAANNPNGRVEPRDFSGQKAYDTYMFYYGIYMGIVKISDLLHDDIRDASRAMSRSVNAQAEYWIRVGMMSELYPELNHQQIKLLMLKSGSDRLLEVINAIHSH